MRKWKSQNGQKRDLKKYKTYILIITVLLMISMSGCKESQQASTEYDSGESVAEVTGQGDPEAALDAIYKNVTIKDVQEADDTVLEDKFYIDLSKIEDHYVRYTSGRFGVADVFMLKPIPEETPAVREQLEQIKISLVKEFENYDIYNAHQIAQNAQVFEQGEYLVLLVMEDNDTAREILDEYLPKR